MSGVLPGDYDAGNLPQRRHADESGVRSRHSGCPLRREAGWHERPGHAGVDRRLMRVRVVWSERRGRPWHACMQIQCRGECLGCSRCQQRPCLSRPSWVVLPWQLLHDWRLALRHRGKRAIARKGGNWRTKGWHCGAMLWRRCHSMMTRVPRRTAVRRVAVQPLAGANGKRSGAMRPCRVMEWCTCISAAIAGDELASARSRL